ALLIRDLERRRVFADLLVGVHGVLLGALLAVTELPAVGERPARLLLDRRSELHLQRRGAFVRLGLGDHVELVLGVVLLGRRRGRGAGGLRDGRRRRRRRRAGLLGAATGRQCQHSGGEAGE